MRSIESLTRNNAALALALACCLSTAAAQETVETADGEQLARSCAVCHGARGISTDPLTPHLAGQPQLYLEKSLFDFVNGARQDPRMSVAVKRLSREQVKALAAWYAALPRGG